MNRGRKPQYGSKRWIELNGLNALTANNPINLKTSKKTSNGTKIVKSNTTFI